MITDIKDLQKYVGQAVTLQGWLYNSRDSGKIAFLIVRDGTGLWVSDPEPKMSTPCSRSGCSATPIR